MRNFLAVFFAFTAGADSAFVLETRMYFWAIAGIMNILCAGVFALIAWEEKNQIGRGDQLKEV